MRPVLASTQVGILLGHLGKISTLLIGAGNRAGDKPIGFLSFLHWAQLCEHVMYVGQQTQGHKLKC